MMRPRRCAVAPVARAARCRRSHREAVRVYIEQTSRRELLDQVLDEDLPRYAEALKRLGE